MEWITREWGLLKEEFREWSLLNKFAVIGAAVGAIVFIAWFLARPALNHAAQGREIAKAEAAAVAGDFATARAIYLAVLDKSPKSPEPWASYATFLEACSSSEAEVAWREAAQRDPLNAELQARRVLSVLENSGPAAAQKELAQVPVELRDTPPILLASADAAIAANQFRVAENLLAKVEAKAPDSPELTLAQSRLALAQGEPLNSAAIEKIAATSGPHQIPALRLLATRQIANGETEAARETLSRILESGNASLDDHLTHLGLLLDTSSDSGPALVTAAAVAKRSESGSRKFLDFLLTRDQLQAASDFLDSLVMTDSLRPFALRLAIQQKDWTKIGIAAEESGFDSRSIQLFRAAIQGHDSGNPNALTQWTAALDSVLIVPSGPDFARLLAHESGWDEAELAALQRMQLSDASHLPHLRRMLELQTKAGDVPAMERTAAIIQQFDPEAVQSPRSE